MWNRVFFVDFKSGQQLRNTWISYILYVAPQWSQGDLETITPNGPLRENTGKERDQQDQWFVSAVTSWDWTHEVSRVHPLLPDGRKSPESSARAGAGTGNRKSGGQQVHCKHQETTVWGPPRGRRGQRTHNTHQQQTSAKGGSRQHPKHHPGRKANTRWQQTQEEYPEQLMILV